MLFKIFINFYNGLKEFKFLIMQGILNINKYIYLSKKQYNFFKSGFFFLLFDLNQLNEIDLNQIIYQFLKEFDFLDFLINLLINYLYINFFIFLIIPILFLLLYIYILHAIAGFFSVYVDYFQKNTVHMDSYRGVLFSFFIFLFFFFFLSCIIFLFLNKLIFLQFIWLLLF